VVLIGRDLIRSLAGLPKVEIQDRST